VKSVEAYRRFRDANYLIAMKMEKISTSKTSVNFYETVWRNNPEDYQRYSKRLENLKFLLLLKVIPK
jgi:hypothetical protein